MTADPPPCMHVVELLTDYLEGALDPVTMARVDVHLAGCGPCATYLEQLRTTITDLGVLPVTTLPADTLTVLEAAFRDLHPSHDQ
jgi:predicted anti-sigma-YlaC factor YlaD